MSSETEQLEAPTHSRDEAQWISLSDLMTSLMMLFMLIAIAFMMKVEADAQEKEKEVTQRQQNIAQELQNKQDLYDIIQAQMKKAEQATYKIRQVAIAYDQTRGEIYDALDKEFHNDLPVWGAEINKDLSIRFKDPEVLFQTGKNELKPKFRMIMDNFFPRYLRIITSPKFKDAIQEIRIEGHTSSQWAGALSAGDAYIKNMELSQSRTRSTLSYVLEMPAARAHLKWLRDHLTANGLSSSHPIYNADGSENMERSQRVEIRIRTNADEKLATILEAEPSAPTAPAARPAPVIPTGYAH